MLLSNVSMGSEHVRIEMLLKPLFIAIFIYSHLTSKFQYNSSEQKGKL